MMEHIRISGNTQNPQWDTNKVIGCYVRPPVIGCCALCQQAAGGGVVEQKWCGIQCIIGKQYGRITRNI